MSEAGCCRAGPAQDQLVAGALGRESGLHGVGLGRQLGWGRQQQGGGEQGEGSQQGKG